MPIEVVPNPPENNEEEENQRQNTQTIRDTRTGRIIAEFNVTNTNNTFQEVGQTAEEARDAFHEFAQQYTAGNDEPERPAEFEEERRLEFVPRGNRLTYEEVVRRERRKKEKELSPGTFGIEIEINNISKLCKDLPEGWSYTSDISVESKAILFRGKPVKIDTKRFNIGKRRQNVGIEIVSPILSSFGELKEVLDIIKETGIKTKSKDCGIHIHVSFPKGMAIISLFKLALKYEPLLYTIGTFGGFSRGKFKDYIYQRPLSHPPIVKIVETNRDLERGNIYHGPVFDINHFPEIKDEEDFSQFLSADTGGKYHAAKYCGINFYSYFYRQTVELRTFNLTTNYSYLKAVINFARDFVFAGLNKYYEEEDISENIEINFINDMEKKEIKSLLEEFLSKYSSFTDSEDVYILRQLVEDSPKIMIPEKVMFHLMFHRNGDNSRVYKYRRKRLLPRKIDSSDAIEPNPERRSDYDFKGDVCAS